MPVMMQKDNQQVASNLSPAISTIKTGLPETKSPIAPTKSVDEKSEITILPWEGLNLPVHFSHYASWHAIAAYCKQALLKEREQSEEKNGPSFQFSAAEFHWGKLSMTLIQEVRKQLSSEIPLLRFY